MANEFQQMFGVFQGAQQNLQNQVLSRQSLAIRQEELGLNRERLQAQREANTLDAMKVQETQVSNRIGMLTSLGEFLSVEDQKHFAESISEDLIKMGRLSPEKAVSYANLEDYRLGVHASLIEGDYEKAQGLFLDFAQHSHPKERAMGLDVLRQEQAVVEARGPFRRAIEDRKAGRIIDQTTADKLRAEDAVGLQQRLDSGDIQSIVSNETMQAIRAKELEADGLRLLDPKMVSDALTIQQMADRGLVVPDEKVQQAVALQQYVDLNKTYANLLANGIEPADSFLSMYHAAAVKAGIQEKVKAPPGAKELEEIEASRERRRTAKFQQNLLAQKAILFENESLKIQQDIAKEKAMIPQIDAITELTRAKTGSEQAKASLLNAQYTNLQKSMQAILPEYQQELQELSTDRQEIVQQLSLLSTNAEANPNQLELLQDQLKQNEDRAQYVQSLVAFGQAVGPDRALKYAQFDEQRQQAEARLKRNSATMEDLRRKTADLRVAQTDSKELDTRLKRKQDEKNDALVLVANEATRRGIGRDAKAVTGLIDEMGFGKVLTAGDVGKALKEEGTFDAKTIKAPITLENGQAGEALLQEDPESPTGFSVVRVPIDGKVQPAIAEKKPLVQIGSPTEREAQVKAKNISQSVDDLLARFEKSGKDIVGPLDQLTTALGRPFGAVPEARLEYEKDLNKLAGEYRHLIFGSALTKVEKESALGFIPDMNDQDADHKAKLKSMKKTADREIQLRDESLGQRRSEVGTKSNEDRLQELLELGATYQEALRVMVEEGRE